MVDTQTTTVIVTYGHSGGAHNIGRQTETGIKVEYGQGRGGWWTLDGG
jgi:hypothetical protein